ncbi:MAG: DNA-binding protein WhiA [Eubacterium sp.]|nr:DNA-binding protein WhiA [Eubacterium sp.]
MSFSSEVKKELAGQIGNARHCQIAELAALLIFCCTVRATDEGEIHIDYESEHLDVTEKYVTLLKKLFHISPEIIVKPDLRRRKKEVYQVKITDRKLAITILQLVRFLSDSEDIAEDVPLVHQVILNRSCCRRAFLRGAFLAAGSVSDPEKSYHFEIVCGEAKLSDQLCELMVELGIDARRVRRQKYEITYVKGSEQIADLLGMMEARVMMLQYENSRIINEVRGNINRKVNCETANINKTANAAARQIEDIELIESTMGLSKLPNGLDEMARVRLQYPTATLSELGDLINPPVGKSGVNHRLRKIGEIAERIRTQGGSIRNG